jgi:hypothetical protein
VRDRHQWYGSWEEAALVGHKLSPTMFPSDEKAALPLERCMRFLPHHNDTGGFFVAVLEKARGARRAAGEGEGAGFLGGGRGAKRAPGVAKNRPTPPKTTPKPRPKNQKTGRAHRGPGRPGPQLPPAPHGRPRGGRGGR